MSGEATYADDVVEAANQLHAYLALSNTAHAELKSLDLARVCAYPGVVGTLTAADIDHNDISPTGRHDEPVLAESEVLFHGQPLFAVVAETREAARRAAQLADAELVERPAVISIDDATEMVCASRSSSSAARSSPPLEAAPPSHLRLDGDRRSGPLLSRRPHRLRRSRRGRRDDRDLLDPAPPPRCSTWLAHVLGEPSAKGRCKG